MRRAASPSAEARLRYRAESLIAQAPPSAEVPYADDLPRYVAQFGFREIGALTPTHLFTLIAARNLGWLVDRFALPPRGVEAPPPDSPPPAEEDPRPPLPTPQRDTWSDDRESAPIEDPADLARVYPSEWRFREACPSLFYLKVLERDLRMPRLVPADGDQGARRETEIPLSQWHPEPSDGPPAPNAHVLVDCSQSMGGQDQRGVAARGAALAEIAG
ncbi:MAG: hypothetical protein QHJ73_09600 [Armatimonadota bacterium]|nr:hypothetical protein [Armatimonadota bacterium]